MTLMLINMGKLCSYSETEQGRILGWSPSLKELPQKKPTYERVLSTDWENPAIENNKVQQDFTRYAVE
ncbi:hypothetical protein Ddye_026727 [Dipteronia dyeriana]|uniref:Uncharacterized protein n=1 Tax=Dipteronia dyeriana TaxID=168575 RepID=A0AAD9TMQ1_9ROSI|nr:hypothetical protein Ddye_026727 [Dipteronia dyeriana]